MTHHAPDLNALIQKALDEWYEDRCGSEQFRRDYDATEAALRTLTERAHRAQRLEAALRWYFGATTIKGLDARSDLLHLLYYGEIWGDPIEELLKRHDEALK